MTLVSSGRNQSKHPLQVPGHGHEAPLTPNVVELAQQKLAEAEHGFDDAEQRFQGVIAQGVELLALLPLQMVDYRFGLCRIVRRGRRLGEAGRSRMDDGTAAPGAINGVIPEAPQAITLAALK